MKRLGWYDSIFAIIGLEDNRFLQNSDLLDLETQPTSGGLDVQGPVRFSYFPGLLNDPTHRLGRWWWP